VERRSRRSIVFQLVRIFRSDAPLKKLILTHDVCTHEQEPRPGVVMLGTILLFILILILIGSLPTWPYSGGWGYYPSGGFGLLVVIVIILLLMGRI